MKFIKILVLVLLTVCFTNCHFTEEITFNEDGSGEFTMIYDLSAMMAKLKEMGLDDSKKEQKEPKKIDSIFYFKDLLVEKADSISKLPKEEQERLKSLETMVMKFKVDTEQDVFDFGYGSSFKSLDELDEVLKKIDRAKKMNSKNNMQMSKLDESAIAQSAESMFDHLDYKFDGKKFTKVWKEEVKRSPEELEALEKEISQMEEAKDMFENMSYTLVYKFPKKIKKVSSKDGVISDDGKAVTIKMNFIEMIRNPELANLEIQLED